MFQNKKIVAVCTILIIVFLLNDSFDDDASTVSESAPDISHNDKTEQADAPDQTTRATVDKHQTQTDVKDPQSTEHEQKDKSYALNIEAFDTLSVRQLLEGLSLRLDCNGYEAINEDEQLLTFMNFTEDHILFNYEKLKPYALYSKEELHNYAEIGDSLAMYTLGLSYINKSMFDDFVPLLLKYNPEISDRPKRVPFNEALMDEGISWLTKAAWNQYPSALFSISQAYESKIAIKKEKFIRSEASAEELLKHDEELAQLELQLLVINSTFVQTFPMLSEVPSRGLAKAVEESMAKLTTEQQAQVTLEKEQKLSIWKEKREINGYPAVVKFDISAEDFLMGSLKRTFKLMCDGIKNNHSTSLQFKS